MSADHSNSSEAATGPPRRARAFDRIGSFRATYAAIFSFLVLYVFSVEGLEDLLNAHFRGVVAEAIQVDRFDAPLRSTIQSNLDVAVRGSRWVSWGGVEVRVLVFGRDGMTPLYLGGRPSPSPPGADPTTNEREARELLPAMADVEVAVPHNALLANGVLVAYAALLLQVLFLFNAAVSRREQTRLDEAQRARDRTRERARDIERELQSVRERLDRVEPAEREHADEVRRLQQERESLQKQLAQLAEREEMLRGRTAQAIELDQERQALEDLLEEAALDLSGKDEEIRELERRLKRASRSASSASQARAKEADALGRRLRALYKNLEFDERAVDDWVALRDASMQLKAEEAVKRLSDEADNVSVRRKVGGLPDHLSIFELGFAGKGRIYYMRGRQRRFRILVVGAKNTQKPDLEYLSRLPREPS
ncbi:MAG: hypothetical protein MJE66_23295 [Proteobacteria bacterium]|nr:hypothetical protein [Pseudomonadota bacterium]